MVESIRPVVCVLFCALARQKEENFVLDHRTAETTAVLLPLERRAGTLTTQIGGNGLIAKKPERFTVKAVGRRSSYDVNGAGGCEVRGRIQRRLAYLNFLQCN